jgi:hypothetical protein
MPSGSGISNGSYCGAGGALLVALGALVAGSALALLVVLDVLPELGVPSPLQPAAPSHASQAHALNQPSRGAPKVALM